MYFIYCVSACVTLTESNPIVFLHQHIKNMKMKYGNMKYENVWDLLLNLK